MSDNLIKIEIDGNELKNWGSISFGRSIGAFDTFEFNAPFEPGESSLRGFFTPVSYKSVKITIDDELFLTGTLLNVQPSLSEANTVTCSGYSKPGVLNDVSIPFEKYPLEFNNQTLEQISKTLAGYFDINVVFTESSGAVFDRISPNVGAKPLPFLIELVKKRGFLITNNAAGDLVFQKTIESGDETNLKDGHTPLLSVTPQIDPQNFYSSVTGLLPGQPGADLESITVKNPFMQTVNRPFVYSENNDLSPADFKDAVKWKAGLMFGAAIKYNASVQGLRDQFDKIWAPNTFVNLLAPRVMVYNETKFIIESVNLDRGEGDRASLTLVVPESYTGEIPKTLPWIT